MFSVTKIFSYSFNKHFYLSTGLIKFLIPGTVFLPPALDKLPFARSNATQTGPWKGGSHVSGRVWPWSLRQTLPLW